MKKTTILILTVLSAFQAFSQSVEFTADTTRLQRFFKEGEWNLRPFIAEQYWVIDKDTMRYCRQDTLTYQLTDNVLDTLYFMGYRQAHIDTICFKAEQPGHFEFVHNDCCGNFYIRDPETKYFPSTQLTIELVNADPKATYLITQDEAGILYGSGDTLRQACRSAMFSNIYNIGIQEVKPCTATEDCDHLACLWKNGVEDIDYSFSYELKEQFTKFLFMSMRKEPYHIVYDIKARRLVKVE